MEANSAIGMVGTICIIFSLLFIFVIGLVTIVKKTRQMYQAGTGNYITGSEAKEIKEQNISINNKLNGLLKKKE